MTRKTTLGLLVITLIVLLTVLSHAMNAQDLDTLLGTSTPVELRSSKLTIEGDFPVLIWSTATERMNDYFTITRSTDGTNYEIIGQIKGAGTVLQPRYYQFVDKTYLTGRLYYKLYQTDIDGATEQLMVHTINLDWKYVDGCKVLGDIISIKYYDFNGKTVENNDDLSIKILAIITSEGIFLTMIR